MLATIIHRPELYHILELLSSTLLCSAEAAGLQRSLQAGFNARMVKRPSGNGKDALLLLCIYLNYFHLQRRLCRPGRPVDAEMAAALGCFCLLKNPACKEPNVSVFGQEDDSSQASHLQTRSAVFEKAESKLCRPPFFFPLWQK